jgi:catechol 2,3-dioxygenase-like lactoylglutathione lyase family enzyme
LSAITHLFAGIPVSDLDRSIDWYTRFFGRPPDNRVVHEDGTPAAPPTFDTAVPIWRSGDLIPLGRDRILRVIDSRPGRGPDDPVLVVETPRGTAGRRAERRSERDARSGSVGSLFSGDFGEQLLDRL